VTSTLIAKGAAKVRDPHQNAFVMQMLSEARTIADIRRAAFAVLLEIGCWLLAEFFVAIGEAIRAQLLGRQGPVCA
jgi:hypothetical protein